ncbi:PREDICTED: complexin-3-like [Nanorana parkeri]|uniref:complexin-3-like n=1 Tax=Nanorana parkeri TaxID=125878 RepID=UPI0008541E7C|nr:PREDICTED: complexin-3-like [Nanorana parkeri]
MASMAKFLFGGPKKNASCCTSGTFAKDLHSPTPPRANVTRRWSSEDQRHRLLRPETTRRSSLHSQQKAERALMREHFREKYKLPMNNSDQQQLRAAGGNIRLPKDLRSIVRHEEPYRQESSFVQLLSYRDLNTGASSVTESLQQKGRCLVM